MYIAEVFPHVTLREDLSWGLTDTRVLHAESGGRGIVIKAAGAANRHIGREITGRQHAPRALVDHGVIGSMLAARRDLNVVAVEHVGGVLAEGTAAECDPAVHRRAGELLSAIHAEAVPEELDNPDYESVMTDKTLTLLDRDHRIEPESVSAVRSILSEFAADGVGRDMPAPRVMTHGDWHPRNWLVDGDVVRIIDFGRFDVRTAESDLGRLSVQQWRGRPDLEAAFLEGYGSDPRNPRTWPINQIREAVGTAVWAREVGDGAFEQQGHRMLADALALF